MKTCVVCGEQVAPEKIGVTCSFTCRAKLRERNRTPDWTRPLKVYPPELVSKVCGLYRSGMTIVEIQKELGMGHKLMGFPQDYSKIGSEHWETLYILRSPSITRK